MAERLTPEYRRNILEGVANWMRSRQGTVWAKEFGYSALMATWADDLDQVRRELDTPWWKRIFKRPAAAAPPSPDQTPLAQTGGA